MRNLTLPRTTPNLQPAVTPDPLRDARAARVAARVRQMRDRAWGITFIIDVCEDETIVSQWLAERDALIREAERLEKGCES